jgi:hypothetical protein
LKGPQSIAQLKQLARDTHVAQVDPILCGLTVRLEGKNEISIQGGVKEQVGDAIALTLLHHLFEHEQLRNGENYST